MNSIAELNKKETFIIFGGSGKGENLPVSGNTADSQPIKTAELNPQSPKEAELVPIYSHGFFIKKRKPQVSVKQGRGTPNVNVWRGHSLIYI